MKRTGAGGADKLVGGGGKGRQLFVGFHWFSGGRSEVV